MAGYHTWTRINLPTHLSPSPPFGLGTEGSDAPAKNVLPLVLMPDRVRVSSRLASSVSINGGCRCRWFSNVVLWWNRFRIPSNPPPEVETDTADTGFRVSLQEVSASSPERGLNFLRKAAGAEGSVEWADEFVLMTSGVAG